MSVRSRDPAIVGQDRVPQEYRIVVMISQETDHGKPEVKEHLEHLEAGWSQRN